MKFRCCKKNQTGNFCSVCGQSRPDERFEGLAELRAFLETKKEAAIKTAETLQRMNEADKKRFGWPEIPKGQVQTVEGWIRRAEQFGRYLKTVNALVAETS